MRGDHERLRQLLLNLLFNAADALGGKGRIEVRAANGGGVVQLVVEDDGPGIDQAIIAQVFDPFVTTKAPGQGTGLGPCRVSHDRRAPGRVDRGRKPASRAARRSRSPCLRPGSGPAVHDGAKLQSDWKAFSMAVSSALSASAPTGEALRARP